MTALSSTPVLVPSADPVDDRAEDARIDAPEGWSVSGHLRQFELFRFVACVSVVVQHALLWVVPASSTFGWGLILIGYYTREAFLFVTAFVGMFSHKSRPRPVLDLWRKRLGGILLPYLVWTALSFIYQLFEPTSSRNVIQTLGNDLRYGYFQLYFLLVIAQFYLVFPLLARLVRATRGHHGKILAASAALELALTGLHHYLNGGPGLAGAAWGLSSTLLNPDLLTCYQVFVVAGMLAADHLVELQGLVKRYSTRLIAASAVAGVATEIIYLVLVAHHDQPGYASDLFQPLAMVWFGMAIVGLYCLGYRWARRTQPGGRSAATWPAALIRWGSNASSGIYLSHVLVLQLVLVALGGVRNSIPWWTTSAILLVTTLAGGATLVTLLRRTPLRRAL